ncbi:hypothetical protein [Actinoplanes siamensis]|uniref:Uncharacterized protein n=1 Tax=Actinoplanes siamensis TaxID=1223317 RepID=A0A919NDN3_9ACTN|nr:hypothetical protein [Actinoplanes siamensis]GIF08988.1 hypothetical protein Asi03nite_65260 [Actinoplanes siamensis]
MDQPLDAPETLALAVAQWERRAAVPEEHEQAAGALAELLYRRGILDQLLARAVPGDAGAGDHFAAMRAADALIEQRYAAIGTSTDRPAPQRCWRPPS